MSKRPLIEAGLEVGESLFDGLLSSEIVKAIPVVGTAVKVCHALDSFRDRLYMTKLKRFVEQLEAIPDEEKQKMREKIAFDPSEFEKCGQHLILLMERITDLEKPSIMAILFLAHIDDHISAEELLRFWDAVDRALLTDLLHLCDDPAHIGEKPSGQFLEKSGLTELKIDFSLSKMGEGAYRISAMGSKLVSSFRATVNKYGLR